MAATLGATALLVVGTIVTPPASAGDGKAADRGTARSSAGKVRDSRRDSAQAERRGDGLHSDPGGRGGNGRGGGGGRGGGISLSDVGRGSTVTAGAGGPGGPGGPGQGGTAGDTVAGGDAAVGARGGRGGTGFGGRGGRGGDISISRVSGGRITTGGAGTGGQGGVAHGGLGGGVRGVASARAGGRTSGAATGPSGAALAGRGGPGGDISISRVSGGRISVGLPGAGGAGAGTGRRTAGRIGVDDLSFSRVTGGTIRLGGLDVDLADLRRSARADVRRAMTRQQEKEKELAEAKEAVERARRATAAVVRAGLADLDDRAGRAGGPSQAGTGEENPFDNTEHGLAIVGQRLYDRDGIEIGRIENIVVGRSGGTLTALVSAGGRLGAGGRAVAVPLDWVSVGEGSRLTVAALAEPGTTLAAALPASALDAMY